MTNLINKLKKHLKHIQVHNACKDGTTKSKPTLYHQNKEQIQKEFRHRILLFLIEVLELEVEMDLLEKKLVLEKKLKIDLLEK